MLAGLAVGLWRGTAKAASDAIDVRDHGAAANQRTDDGPALKRAYQAALSAGRPLYLAAGHYRLESPLDWNLGSAARSGISVAGDGPGLTILDFVTAGTGPDLLVHCDASASFYSQLRDFSIRGRGTGAVLQIGMDGFADVHNGLSLDRLVINADGTGSALRLNAVCNSRIDVVANAGGTSTGTALQMRQAQFCIISGAQGHAATGTWLEDGYNFGNVFTAIDYEVLGTAVRISGAHCARNTWIGGTLANLAIGFDCTAGNNNRVINMNFGVRADQASAGLVGLLVGEQ